ncbi:carbohydrate ABC transporter permease [Dictyobacter aurantiacus]|uniref:Sugar ABC transporter permease n=1 Tax=Dictyobacter aurantiacus TaxID=1936993 RepID=A0A401ZP74_9CHLR|nr:carbohydrate ABC transporter permease [Dictyobacter aurantiacus]GCE08594.1 sugar ABC transporter permease [Dictyobacter aurantiacus]
MATQSIQNTNVTTTRRPLNLPRQVGKWGAFAILLIFAVIWLLPIAWVLDTSFKPEGETTILPLTWLSSAFNIQAYISVLSSSDLPRWYFNSVFTSVIISAAVVLLASMASFSISRIPFKGRSVVFWLILCGLMIPGQVLLVPLFSLMQSFQMIDTYWGIILPQIFSPFAVFIFKQFFDGIPHEYEEAARMDGASPWRIYWQIWMPLARPAIATIAISTFVAAWNNFIWPFLVVTGTDMMTVPVGLATVQTSYGIRYAQIMASAILGGLPAVIVFVIFQRQIVAGLAGGLKD